MGTHTQDPNGSRARRLQTVVVAAFGALALVAWLSLPLQSRSHTDATIATVPTGATVVLDGRVVGETPMSLRVSLWPAFSREREWFEPGVARARNGARHEIELRKPGYHPRSWVFRGRDLPEPLAQTVVLTPSGAATQP